MHALSLWFSKHTNFARLSIACCHFVFTAIAWQLAGWLQRLPFYIPLSFFLCGLAATSLMAALAQIIKTRFGYSIQTKMGYALVRMKYAMVLLASYLLVVCWFYSDAHVQYTGYTVLHGSFTSAVVANKNAKEVERKGGSQFSKHKEKLSLRALKKELKEARMLRKQGDETATAQTNAIIGIMLLAVILSILVLTAACSLSCNGFGTGSVLVGVGGMALIIWGTVVWIRHVNRVTRKKREAAAKQGATSRMNIGSNSNAIR